MTRREVLLRAAKGRISWLQAAEIIGISPRHLRRVRRAVELHGSDALLDGRARNGPERRIAGATVAELCRLKREVYPDFSMRHFHEFAVEKHGLKVSYSWTRGVLQAAGLVQRAPGRGKYRRRRERRPMVGMLLHLDASTHGWIAGLPMWDLVVMLDDADGRILYAQFVEQEGTRSTLAALDHVLRRQGRFSAFYTDRGSHFANTTVAGKGPDVIQGGQVPRVLKTLGIEHILAYSPQARGRSERAFGTIQGRLPQELRLAGIRDYAAANRYLTKTFVPSFNRRFTVAPAEAGSAFVPVVGVDLRLLLSIQHERIVRNDSTVTFGQLTLQLPKGTDRPHYVRCPVVIHELLDGKLAVSYQGRQLAQYSRDGELISISSKAQHRPEKLWRRAQ